MTNTVFYEPELRLNGTIPELVDWANRYTSDYTDQALERISELARQSGFEEKYVEIPLLLRNERLFEGNNTLKSAYARLQIDHYLDNRIGLSMSNFGEDGTELEIREEDGKVLISLSGMDEEGAWSAANAYTLDEFMSNAANWLDVAVGETRAYGFQREEP